MDKERWERLKQVFGDALEREAAERESFVREAAKDDPVLLAELLRYLAENDRESGLLSAPVLAGARAPGLEERPRFAPSTLLARRFRIMRFIARGGMGEVYEAEDLELGVRVALKAIRQRVALDAELRALFRREIQLARRVTHPNVCRIFDLAQHEDAENGGATLLLSMELIEGQSLAEHLRLNGPLTFRDALPLIEDIAAGLQAVHDAGVVHGDLKPANVMLVSRDGETAVRAVVMDFGMAVPVAHSQEPTGEASPPPDSSADAGQPTVTFVAPGWVLRGGTPEYFAPEQTAGAPASTATDIYALALVIADMLGVPRPIRLKPEPERMPSPWARVLRRSLETDPARRYSKPAEMAQALRASVDRRWRTTAIASASLLLVLGALAVFYFASRETVAVKNDRLILTEGPLTAWCPSPDGKIIAATSWDTGDLVLSQVSNGKIRRLTHKGTTWQSQFGGAYGARFSPDGRQIVYEWATSRTDGELRIVAANGDGDRVLYRDPAISPHLIDWSPDGSRILVRIQSKDLSARLALLDSRTGSVLASRDDPTNTVAGTLIFGTNSTNLIFDARTADHSRLEIHRLPWTGAESTLVARSGNNSIVGWSPDRHRLIFASDARGSRDLWSIQVSAAGAEGEAREIMPHARDWEALGISQTGALFYRQEFESKDVYTAVLDLAAGRTVSPPRRVVERFNGSSTFPNWSADGRFLVFNVRPDSMLGVFELRTGATRDLRVDLRYAGRPQWSEHDGSIIAIGGGRDGSQGLFRIDPRTGAAALLKSGKELGSILEGVWSPDGKIHFNRAQQREGGIFRWDVATGERRTLYVPPPGADVLTENLALAPDGRTLAFHVRNLSPGTGTLMLVPADGGEARPLFTIHPPEAFRYGSFTWTPDSKRILISRTSSNLDSKSDPVSQIWQVPVDGGAPTKIDFPTIFVQSLRLNPDGKTIAFTVQHWNSEIWVLQNFL